RPDSLGADLDQRRQLCTWAGPREQVSEVLDRYLLQRRPKGEDLTKNFLSLKEQMGDLEGIPSQFTERILHSDGLNTQNLLPDLFQSALQPIPRLDKRLIPRGPLAPRRRTLFQVRRAAR